GRSCSGATPSCDRGACVAPPCSNEGPPCPLDHTCCGDACCPPYAVCCLDAALGPRCVAAPDGGPVACPAPCCH
ncbi:MAG TPA: hypothetical protein VHB21_26475, partial [Minicystis sp.]|nr:hypothetical protein [Minicystis sp.]